MKMKENLLIKICLVSVVIGIIIMFVSSKTIHPKEIKIKDISEKYNYIKIVGKITEVSTSKSGTTFLKIKDDSGTIDAIIFKNSIKNLDNIKSGEKIEVIGKPEKYKGKMEIIINSIQ